MRCYRFKLYSNAAKSRRLSDIIDSFGRLYNYCISLHKKHRSWYGTMLHGGKLKNFLAKHKHTKAGAWIAKLPSQAVQDVVERIDNAYTLFFSNNKKGIKTGKPSYKKITKYKSFTLKQHGKGYKLLGGNKIRILGEVYKFHKSREIEGKIKNITIKRDNLGNIWLMIVTDHKRSEKKPLSGKSVGFDFGMKHFLVGSDCSVIDFPLFKKNRLCALKKLSRSYSKKKPGSKNQERERRILARFHRKIRNKRTDYQWKFARWLLTKYDVICLENLDLTGMQKRYWKKIEDYAFYELTQRLIYLADVFGKKVVRVGRYFPSSMTCSNCGFIYRDLQLKDRNWQCPQCKHHHDRDFNASVNILREGVSSLGTDSFLQICEGSCC